MFYKYKYKQWIVLFRKMSSYNCSVTARYENFFAHTVAVIRLSLSKKDNPLLNKSSDPYVQPLIFSLLFYERKQSQADEKQQTNFILFWRRQHDHLIDFCEKLIEGLLDFLFICLRYCFVNLNLFNLFILYLMKK